MSGARLLSLALLEDAADEFAMEVRSLQNDEEEPPSSSCEESSTVGWPFGLSLIYTPDQFASVLPTFLQLPLSSDADAASSSASDTDTRSDAASSFFRDSRRITLGSLIALPDLETAASLSSEDIPGRRSFLSSCGILELLGPCGRTIAENEEFVAASSDKSRADCDAARTSVAFEDALGSPDWSEDQFASCRSVLSGGATPMSVLSTPPRSHKKVSRSSSTKSFFSSLCCRIDTDHDP